MTLIATFKVPITFRLDSEQIKEAQAALNTYHLGDSECNHLNPSTMNFEPKHPEKETEQFKQSHSNARMSRTAFIAVGLDENGCLSII